MLAHRFSLPAPAGAPTLGALAAGALAAGVLAAPALASAPAAHAAACKAGVTTVHGVQQRTFCGTARASVTVAGHAAKLSGSGQCQVSGGYFTVNIGTIVLGETSRYPDYLGLDIKRSGATVGGWQSGGKKYGVTGTTTFGPGKKSGHFTGTNIAGGGAVSASFTC